MRRLLLLLLAVIATSGPACAACSVQPRGSVPFTSTRGYLLVPIMVNGAPATFVLDTGATRSMVTPAAMQRLHITRSQWVDTTLQGAGGVVEHADADPRSFSLGGLALQRRGVDRRVSLTVGDVPGAASGNVDGLLGRDVLSSYDLQLDMVQHRLTLFAVHGCSGGGFIPWQPPYAGVVAASPMDHTLVVPISIDGHKLRALLDTGATATLITLPGMIRLGLRPASLAQDRSVALHGIGRQTPPEYRHPFARLQVGDETIKDPMLWVAPIRVIPFVDALLGADWLRAQSRVWLSFATNQVFFTPR